VNGLSRSSVDSRGGAIQEPEMKLVRHIVLCAGLTVLSSAVAAPTVADKQGRENIVNLYLISFAADRCGFPMTAKQADAVDREVKALAQRMNLSEDQTDGLYSDADVAFEKQGPKVCDRDGSFAKMYKDTLQKLTGQ
jgi:hypothetical protein